MQRLKCNNGMNNYMYIIYVYIYIYDSQNKINSFWALYTLPNLVKYINVDFKI